MKRVEPVGRTSIVGPPFNAVEFTVQNGLLEITPAPVTTSFKHSSSETTSAETRPPSHLVEARRRTSSASYLIGKRLLDLVVCCTLVLLMGPFLLVLAIVVRLSSHGPAFYRETRVGQFGRKFTIYKFRSMYTREYLTQTLGYNECEISLLRRRQYGKVTGDVRITPIGRLLRVTSLDELPQLFNVIKGDMSLVGPRPVVAAELMSYADQQSLYKLVLPGITGLWQISGRSNLSFQERVTLDSRYCREWTFAGDLTILGKTLPAVIKRHGAY